jgi:hypothetical protein
MEEPEPICLFVTEVRRARAVNSTVRIEDSCSAWGVRRIVHPGEKPLKAKIACTDPERYRDLAELRIQAAGMAFSRVIGCWEIEHRSDDGLISRRTVQLHMRRAHSHLYWSRAGRRQPHVKFLLPISVRGGAPVEEMEKAHEAAAQ